ncbi:glycosyltransferase family 4 protein [Planctomonas sp. JC2975]|uniref:glycosyltransferase family 4 protein n=1 Tax=Planctomonas sp. JC2975 TaxID=2729626 RepID=UPI0023F93E0E|nr:glycosyltransferase family 4 protein [Planctomonas sp. JC2975]
MSTGTARPLRIAMISYYLPSGSKIGVGYQVHELATELVRRGHHVDVFSECPPVEGAVYGHRRIELSGRMRTFRFALHLRRVDFSSYDVLHAHGDDYWLWRRRVARHVRTIHGSCFEEAIHIKGFTEKLRMVALGFSEVLASIVADRTSVVSPRTRRWTPWVKTVIPNGVDATRFRPDAKRRSDAPTVLFVGTWTNRKRGADLARVFQRDVLPSIPSARLEMVCRDAPADPGPGVVVLGELTDAQLVEAYQRAWVFCLPSDYEGFGIPYAEAMASGLPVVATPNIGAQYVTDDGAAGVLAPLESIGVALRDLLADSEARALLAQRSSARGSQFSLDRVVDAYEQLYTDGVVPLAPAKHGRSRATISE